jgi:hypothetical protein
VEDVDEAMLQSDVTAVKKVMHKLKQDLDQLLTECLCSAQATAFIKQLYFLPYIWYAARGKASVSRATVATLFQAYVQSELSQEMVWQQQYIRLLRGEKLGYDCTYKSAASLSGALAGVKTSHGRAKTLSLKASVATLTAEDGVVLAAVLTPSDKHDTAMACIASVYGADLPEEIADNDYLQMIAKKVRDGGNLGRCPRVISTDNVGKDFNIWQACAHPVVEACKRWSIPVLVPEGVQQSLSQLQVLMPVSTLVTESWFCSVWIPSTHALQPAHRLISYESHELVLSP